MQSSKGDADMKNRVLDTVGVDEGGIIWKNNIETYIIIWKIDSQWELDIWYEESQEDALWLAKGME